MVKEKCHSGLVLKRLCFSEERAVKDEKTVKRADRDRLTLDEQLKVISLLFGFTFE